MKKHIFCQKTEQALEQFLQEINERKKTSAHPLLLGIGGPGGSGKSMLGLWLKQNIPNSEILSLDEFRFSRSDRPRHAPFGSHPDAMNLPLIEESLLAAKERRPVLQPSFDRQSGTSLQGDPLPLAEVYLVEGEMTAHSVLNEYLDLLILVHTSKWTQLATRLNRDRNVRGYSFIKTLRIFIRSNLMDYPRYGKPSKARAHLVLYRHPRKGLTLVSGSGAPRPLDL